MISEYWEDIREDIKLRKRLIEMYKLSRGCAICGYNKCAAALDFHHKGDGKKDCISRLMNSCLNFKKVLEEIEKCTILCSNCHRELHDKERKDKII